MADHEQEHGHQRRRLLQAGLGAAALGAVPGAGQFAAHAQGAFDWKKFKGEKIEVFLVKSPRGDLLTKYHKEFEDLTGITVGSEMIPEQQQRQKAVIEFNSGNTSFDVIALSYHVQKRLFGKNKLDGGRAAAARRQVADRSEPRLRRLLQGRHGLGDAARRPHRQPAVQHRPVGDLLQQGALRREEHRLSEELPRDRRRRREAQRSRQGRLRVSSGAASRTPTCRSGRASCWATAAASSTPTASSRPTRPRRSTPRRCTRRCSRSTDRRVSPASTGTRRRACSCRARRRCGSTASASRSRSRIRPSRASSARSATA